MRSIEYILFGSMKFSGTQSKVNIVKGECHSPITSLSELTSFSMGGGKARQS
jgi:hypothetical protein